MILSLSLQLKSNLYKTSYSSDRKVVIYFSLKMVSNVFLLCWGNPRAEILQLETKKKSSRDGIFMSYLGPAGWRPDQRTWVVWFKFFRLLLCLFSNLIPKWNTYLLWKRSLIFALIANFFLVFPSRCKFFIFLDTHTLGVCA